MKIEIKDEDIQSLLRECLQDEDLSKRNLMRIGKVTVEQSYNDGVYETTFSCRVGGVEYREPFPTYTFKKVVQQNSLMRKKTKRAGSHGSTEGRHMIVACFIAYYYQKKVGIKSVDIKMNGNWVGIFDDRFIFWLKELVDREMAFDRVSSFDADIYDRSSPIVTRESFENDINIFRSHFFSGPDWAGENENEKFEYIREQWNGLNELCKRATLDKAIKDIFVGIDRESEKRRNALREEILRQAWSYPLISTMRKKGKLLELQELLRHVTLFEVSGKGADQSITAEVQPPLHSITEHILRPLYQLKGKDYTGYDYIKAHYEISSIAAQDRENHSFFLEDIPPELQKYVIDAEKNKLLEKRSSDLRKYGIGEDEADQQIAVRQADDDYGRLQAPVGLDNGPYKYLTKQHRMFVWAMGSALTDNARFYSYPFYERTAAARELLLQMKSTEEETRENASAVIADRHWSGPCFFSVVYLEYIDALHRLDLIRELIRYAQDFNTENDQRDRQERSLSILSYLLLEKFTEYPKEFCETLFLNCYGRTLYQPQAEMYLLLKNKSDIFANYAKDCFWEACFPNKDIREHSLRNHKDRELNPDKQPFFNFLQGDLYSDSELQQMPEAFRFVIKCCKLQTRTWYLTPADQEDSSVDGAADAAFTLLKIGLAHMKQPKAEDGECYFYGVAMLFYGIANLRFRHGFEEEAEKVEDRIRIRADRDLLLEALLRCDYHVRKANPLYRQSSGSYHMLFGSIRVVCAYRLKPENEAGFSVALAGDPREISDYYKRAMEFHLAGNQPRHAFLICRMLSYYDFGARFDPVAFLKWYPGISKHYKGFLPYYNMPDGMIHLFLQDPCSLWTAEDNKTFLRK